MFSKNPSTHTLYTMNLKENMKGEDMYKPHKISIEHYPLRYLTVQNKRTIWSYNID